MLRERVNELAEQKGKSKRARERRQIAWDTKWNVICTLSTESSLSRSSAEKYCGSSCMYIVAAAYADKDTGDG